MEHWYKTSFELPSSSSWLYLSMSSTPSQLKWHTYFYKYNHKHLTQSNKYLQTCKSNTYKELLASMVGSSTRTERLLSSPCSSRLCCSINTSWVLPKNTLFTFDFFYLNKHYPTSYIYQDISQLKAEQSCLKK